MTVTMRIIVTPALQLKKLRLSSSLVSAQSAHRAYKSSPPPSQTMFSCVQLVTLSGFLLAFLGSMLCLPESAHPLLPRRTTASPLLTSSDSPGEAPIPSTRFLSDLITVARSPFFMSSLDCFCLSGYAINFLRAVTRENSTL